MTDIPQHIDHRDTPITAGQTVSYWDDREGRLYSAIVQQVAHDQVLLNAGDRLVLMEGRHEASSTQSRRRHLKLVVVAPTP